MKYFFIFIVLVFSCASNGSENTSTQKFEIDSLNSSLDNRVYVENPAQYKYGSNEALLNIVYNSISKISVKELDYTQGIFQMDIDTSGFTSNFIVVRSISKAIDSEISKICDTLQFDPASINGKAIPSTVTLPIRIELGN